MTVTAIFDIGKTNKKFFLFDEQFREVYRSYTRLEESVDEDGFACENLESLTNWILETFREAKSKREFDIRRLNFSTYGASFVHLDKSGKTVTPLYNYLKPYPEDLLEDFFEKYGPAANWATQTASPVMGMLNSGLQLYWLKHRKPEAFSQIHQTLHFPQYCAQLFTGLYFSDYTSIGCHTGMWDFRENGYHLWISTENIDKLLPPIRPTNTAIETVFEGKKLLVGVGIHDSSAALLPYILENTEPFLLISTGTWSIALNPFSRDMLSTEDLDRDCLNYLRVDGLPVRAARLFLGNEYKIWAKKLAEHFQQPYEKHRQVKPNPKILQSLEQITSPVFHWESISWPGFNAQVPDQTRLEIFSNYETAYHQLIKELVDLQVTAIQLAKGNTPLKKIFIDGGFVDNALFLHLLANRLDDFELIPTQSPLGSAMGAAMAVNDLKLNAQSLQTNISPKNQVTFGQ